MVTTCSDHPPPSQGIDLDRRSAERENSVWVGLYVQSLHRMQDEVLNAAEVPESKQSPHPRSSLTRRGRGQRAAGARGSEARGLRKVKAKEGARRRSVV